MRHRVFVEASPPSEPLYHVAFCTCGKQSGQHVTVGGAQADLEQIHAREAAA